MSDFEILKECKQAYEILNDLKDNCELISSEDTESRVKINKTMDLLSDLYSNAWELLASNKDTYKLLETNIVGHYGNKCLISDFIDYAYLDTWEDENMYSTECEVDIKEYKSEEFNNVEQARDEYVRVFKETRQDIENLLNNKNASDIECNEMIDDIVECLNGEMEKERVCWWL